MSLPRRLAIGLGVCVLCCVFSQAQTPDSTTGQELQSASTSVDAAASLTQSLAALTGGQTITDVVLTGTATRTAGSSLETLPVRLEAKGFSASKVEFTSSAFVGTEVSSLSGGVPTCEWIDSKATIHKIPTHNCMVPVWFFPALSPLGTVSSTKTAVELVGQETYDGNTVDHYRLKQTFGSPKQVGSAVFLGVVVRSDVYCDATSHLPIAFVYVVHPDKDPTVDIPVEIRFADYQSIGGITVPTSITRLMNGSVALHLAITSAATNTGISDTEFTLQ